MGRPKGAWSDKKFRAALNAAVSEKGPKGQRKLREMAEKLVEVACAGDVAAIREVADRLDGKPNQTQIIDATVTNHMVMAPPPEKDADEWANRHGPH